MGAYGARQSYSEIHGDWRQCLSRQNREAALWPGDACHEFYCRRRNRWAKPWRSSLIRDDEAVADTNFILDYFRRTEDNRLLFGGGANYSTLEPTDVGAFMKQRMVKVFPQLRDVKIDFAWGGFIAITSNRLPDCGQLSPTTYYAHGYSGQGVALAGMYGKLMAEAIRGTAERFDLLARVKHLPFPGGAIRTPLVGGGHVVLSDEGCVGLNPRTFLPSLQADIFHHQC